MLTSDKNGFENKRLCVLQKSNDGFYIAEKDLELRGPGQILGYRQSGLPDFVLDNLPNNKLLIEKAREEAIKVVNNDPDLKENILIRNILIDNSDNKFIHDFLNWNFLFICHHKSIANFNWKFGIKYQLKIMEIN